MQPNILIFLAREKKKYVLILQTAQILQTAIDTHINLILAHINYA